MQKGSIFCTVRNNQKRFFQYVGSDLSQLNSDVIGIFRRNYTHNEFPNVARILDDTYEYVLHTTISLGKRMCGWEYLGETSEPHKIDDVLFVTQHSHPLFYRVGEPIDGGWRIWKMNEDAAIISYHPNGKLTNGMVFPPYSIEELLFDTGFDEFYDIHATGERKKSVWFQQQKWDDTIEREFINKLNLTHPELAPEYILSQADILMQSDNEINRDAGVRLLHIVIEKYKTMPLAYTRACDILASFYFRNSDYNNAHKYYSIIYEYNEANPRQRYRHLSTIFQIVRIIIANTRHDDYSFAKKLLLVARKEIQNMQVDDAGFRKTFNELATKINQATDGMILPIKNKWYENEDWNSSIEQRFFQNVAKDSVSNATRHVRQQASTLLQKDNPDLQTAAIRLFEYIFNLQSCSASEIALCHQILGTYYNNRKEYMLARIHLEASRKYYKKNRISDMMLIPINLGIVESLVALHKTDDIQYAQTLLDELKDTLFQKDELLQYYDLQSKICQL